jgi:hypothetical protein
MKRGQIQSQIFVYILVLVVVGAVALIGFSAITGITNHLKLIEMEQFKKTMSEDVADCSDYGEVCVKSYNLPSGAIAMCFFDNDPLLSSNTPKYQSPLIEDSSDAYNVFIIKKKAPIKVKNFEAFNIDKLNLEGSKYVCIDASSGDLDVTFEGLGKEGALLKV